MPPPHPQSGRLHRLLQQTIGPSPWYWETFPELCGSAGQIFTWQHHGNDGQLAYLVTLHLRSQPDKPLIALNSYCRPFTVEPNRLGLWCPDGRNLRFVLFELDTLEPFDYEEIAGWFKPSPERIYSATPPLTEFSVSAMLKQGTHPIEVPDEFHDVEELLISAQYGAKTKDDAAAAIYVVYPHAGLVDVLPQRWFTPNQFDVGMQWITRLTRDPVSHRILGEAMRFGCFELTDDGCDLAYMIEA
jgi:hypothetical protein